MNFHRLSFFASIFLTFAMITVALAFEFFQRDSQTTKNYYIYLIVSVLIVLIVNYLALDFLFNAYEKKQIKKISEILPEETISEEHVGFKELGERIQKNVTEIDTMKEMEIYRKEYLGNVSHELKTPLFSIQGYVETLIDGGVENLNIRDKYLQRIDKSVERLLNIVKDLDMISQFETGEISLNYSVFDLNILVKEIFDLLDLEAQNSDAKLILQTSSVGSLLVKADKQKISQVLINLISNAIHYANREKAQVLVLTKIINQKILVEVIDNGMGIKPEVLPRIFERFYRIETSRNRKNGGSGLGLAIVKHILEAHGENISVESVYLEGTKFSFRLQKT